VRALLGALRAELLKQRRSPALGLVALAGLFIPSIILASRIKRGAALGPGQLAPDLWLRLWDQHAESVTLLVLPLTALLATSLVVQVEVRSNAWKQVHASPLPLGAIYAAKLGVLLSLVAGFFAVLAGGIWLAAVVPALAAPGAPLPAAPFPARLFCWRFAACFAEVLPVVSLQFVFSLRMKSFLASLGVGLALWICALGAMSWKFIYLIPYGYAAMDHLLTTGHLHREVPFPLPWLGLCVFAGTAALGFALYRQQEDRG